MEDPTTKKEMEIKKENDRQLSCGWKIIYSLGVIFCLWVFLVGLGLMGDSFKVLGGKSAGNLFGFVTDPIVGLMVGVLTTVLVQSSSTSTSIVVGLVGSGIMDVQTAVPIIMGANIGTSVTSTLVALGQMNDKAEFERAFAGATVHDMFNYLAVCALLPIEIITNAIAGGSGGMLYWISYGLTAGLHGADGGTFTSPTKAITSPVTKALISVDKNKIKALSMGLPQLATCIGTDEKPKLVAKVSYHICGNQTALDEALAVWNDKIIEGSLVKKGAFAGYPDEVSGSVSLVLSLILLCGALFGIVQFLKRLVISGNQDMFRKVLNMNGYLAILMGALMTICVQSSSIITSTLVPLVGLGTLTLEGMLPLTLGANIGTTCTALLAAVATGKVSALQIALCHLVFNILGICIFYPIPVMRRQPIRAARGLGYMTVCYRVFPFVYIACAFFILPLVILGISQMFQAGTVAIVFGSILCVVIAAFGIGFIYMYKFKGWNEKISAHLKKAYEAREVDVPKDTDDTKLPEAVCLTAEPSPEPSPDNSNQGAKDSPVDNEAVVVAVM